MKKPENNQRPSKRGNGQRRNNTNKLRNSQDKYNSSNSQNRNSSGGRKSLTPHLWASSSSSTALTSHLSIINKRNQNETNKNITGKTGTRKSNGKPEGNLRYGQNGQNLTHAERYPKKRHRDNQPNKIHQNRLRGDSQNTPVKSAQRNKPKYNKTPESKTNTFGIDPFKLFCAYHLGISPTNQYQPSNINEVANRFKLDPGVIRQILKKYGMDSASLLDRDFDMAMAQLDIQVAPEGVNRTELARNIFKEFLKAPIKKRDWKKILAEDNKENAKIFGS